MSLRWPKINQIILIIIIAEFVLVTAFGLLSPIFAIFVTEQIKDGTVKVVGFAIAVQIDLATSDKLKWCARAGVPSNYPPFGASIRLR